ncbi:hypothetical protein SR882_10345 [Guyparkeria halophila]|uniref:Antitoxin n=1 Tax=Guyparkeria halophila TaxID=47960 RepID=A0ABZ0YX52_9GAMM|nr:hypothetical protein [Guyparkeria halophila]WQH16149.1 hypothetical protein SR882_10345 [Guyparkeria halophila]
MRWRQRVIWWLLRLACRLDPDSHFVQVHMSPNLRTTAGPVFVSREDQEAALEQALVQYVRMRRELVIANHAETALARHHPELFEENTHGEFDSRS